MSDMTDHSHRTRDSLFRRIVARFDEGEVMRWAFRGLVVGTVLVLGLDIKGLIEREGGLWRTAQQEQTVYLEPVLPPVDPAAQPAGTSVDPREHVTTDHDRLRRPLSFELGTGGVMRVEGSVDVGAAARFAEEIGKRGEYVRLVTLNSPGGSLEDAMSISSLIREKGLATMVEDGAICASSCPLIMAGGTERSAGARAAIGLHQFYAGAGTVLEPGQAMSDAQATTARISRHLAAMEVDPNLWLHALDTPPQSLYYLSGDEMRSYGLVTEPIELVSRTH